MRWLPNLLTLLRLPLAPWVAVCVLNAQYRLALVVLIAAGATDGLDGYLARRLQVISRFGALADPVADKVLLVTAYVSLGFAGLVPMWLLVVVLGRDLLILLLAGVALATASRIDLSPSVWGKLSTLVQMVTGVTVIGTKAFEVRNGSGLVEVLVVITAITTSWSGLHYAWRGMRSWSGRRPAEKIDASQLRE
jgi:cardiolipin synthase (CMP-forming)